MENLNNIGTTEITSVLDGINALKKDKLSKEEEYLLAMRMHADPSLIWEFCSHYMLWAVKIAKWLYSSVSYDPAYSFEDVVLMAVCELATAAEKYQPSRARFTTCSFSIIMNNVREQLHLKKGSSANRRRPEEMLSFEPFQNGELSYDLHRTCGLEDQTLMNSDTLSEFSQFGEETAEYLLLWIIYDLSISEIARRKNVSRCHVDRLVKKALKQIKSDYLSMLAA